MSHVDLFCYILYLTPWTSVSSMWKSTKQYEDLGELAKLYIYVPFSIVHLNCARPRHQSLASTYYCTYTPRNNLLLHIIILLYYIILSYFTGMAIFSLSLLVNTYMTRDFYLLARAIIGHCLYIMLLTARRWTDLSCVYKFCAQLGK